MAWKVNKILLENWWIAWRGWSSLLCGRWHILKATTSKQMRKEKSSWKRKNTNLLWLIERAPLKFFTKEKVPSQITAGVTFITVLALLRLKKHPKSSSLFYCSLASAYCEWTSASEYLLWRRIKNIYLFFTTVQGLLPQSEIGFCVYTWGAAGKNIIKRVVFIQFSD